MFDVEPEILQKVGARSTLQYTKQVNRLGVLVVGALYLRRVGMYISDDVTGT